MIQAMGLSILAYLLGSIPTGYIYFKFKEKKDIRFYGSKNIGATNILRTSGLFPAIIVLILDVTKGLLPAILAKQIIPSSALGLVLLFFSLFSAMFSCFSQLSRR